MTLRKNSDGNFDLRLYTHPDNPKIFLYEQLLSDYDYDSYKEATLKDRTKIELFLNRYASATIKLKYSILLESHQKREAEEKEAQSIPSSSVPSTDPVEQLSSTVAKLSLESGSQHSSSVQDIPQSSKTLILSTTSSVKIDPTTMEDKDLFPLIRGTVDREERRRLMFGMSHEQQSRFITWNEELAAKKEKLRLLQEEQRRIEAEQERLRQKMSSTLTTYAEQSYHEVTTGPKKNHITNGF